MDSTEIEICRNKANSVLTQIPGVIWVGFGVKEVGGMRTETMALRVYVEEKRPANVIPQNELIPAEFEGLPTDVLRITRSTPEGAEDLSRHFPLLSGISITNRKLDPDAPEKGFSLGSIGFFATMADLNGKENIFLVSNNHVIGKHGGAAGETIYQPGFLPDGKLDPDNRGPIGKIHHPGMQGHHNFQDTGDGQPLGYFVDCGLAKLDISISSWCDCNCKQSYRNRLHDFEDAPNDKIEGIARAVVGSTVSKSGRATGRTTGVIVDCNGAVKIKLENNTPINATNVICIEPINPPDEFFSDASDSGGPLLNDQNQLIGIHFGSNRKEVKAAIANNDPNPPDPVAHSCHIGAVLDYLGHIDETESRAITPISTQNPPIGPAGKARNDQNGIIVGPEDHTVILQERTRRTKKGRRVLDAFLAHREEIVRLVNHCRPVLVVWHRGKGPAFVAHLRESVSRPGYVIPRQIDGQDRQELLTRMADVLAENGSTSLRAFLSEYRDEVLRLTDGIGDIHAFVAELEDQELESKHG